MRNNAPVEHCVAEAFILHREIVLTMKANITSRVSPDYGHRYCAMKNKKSTSYEVLTDMRLRGLEPRTP